jgi:hypothetical protein
MTLAWLKKRRPEPVPGSRIAVKTDSTDNLHHPAPCGNGSNRSIPEITGSCLGNQSPEPVAITDLPDRPAGRCGFITGIDVVSQRLPEIVKEQAAATGATPADVIDHKNCIPEGPGVSHSEKHYPAVSVAQTGTVQAAIAERPDLSGTEGFSLWGNRIPAPTSTSAKRISVNRQTI